MMGGFGTGCDEELVLAGEVVRCQQEPGHLKRQIYSNDGKRLAGFAQHSFEGHVPDAGNVLIEWSGGSKRRAESSGKPAGEARPGESQSGKSAAGNPNGVKNV